MLNPTFSKHFIKKIKTDYVAPEEIANRCIEGNSNFETGSEYRLQDIFGEEVWMKLKKAGITKEKIEGSSILEICAGNGFLTYNILKKCNPSEFYINDISKIELDENQRLIKNNFSNISPNYIHGDIHNLEVKKKFDIIIGNSFLHHFYNVPKALESIFNLLNEEGLFISLHEPTPLSTVVEGGKMYAYPIGIFFPNLINEIARKRYKSDPSKTDLWLFEKKKFNKMLNSVGFKNSKFYSWNLTRPIVVQKFSLHLSPEKKQLSDKEIKLLRFSIKMDSFLNKFLPHNFFGSLCIVAKK